MVQFGDDTYDEERVIEKRFRCVPEKYKQIARSIESLLDLSTMTIEEALGRLKVINTDEPQSLSGPITTGGKLLLTREQWDSRHGDRRRGSPPPRGVAASAASRVGRATTLRPGREDVSGVIPMKAPEEAPPADSSRRQKIPTTNVSGLAIGPRNVDSHTTARPTSHRRRRSRLCSWHMRASS